MELPKWLLAAIVTAIPVFSLVGCVEAETELTFRTDESGSLVVNYLIDSRALEIGMFDDDGAILPLPLGRRDFEQTAASHPALELRSYRSRRENGTTRIEAEYRFGSVDALQVALGPRAGLTVRQEGGSTFLRHQLFSGFETRPEDSAFAEEFFEGARFSMIVHAPRTIESSSIGKPDGRTVRINYRAIELLSTDEPLILELRW